MSKTGKKEVGKYKPTLTTPLLIKAISTVREFGNQKYDDPDNWKDVDPELFKDALYRHWLAYLSGESLDDESHLPHLWHMATNLMFLIELEERTQKPDDHQDPLKLSWGN